MSGIAATFTVTSGRAARVERAVDRMREQLLAGAGFAEQQHRRFDLRRAPRLALHFEARRARADEARERVFRAPRLRERLARRDQLLLHARVVREERRERLQFVEEREADAPTVTPASSLSGRRVTTSGSRSVSSMSSRIGLPVVDDLAHQAVRDHRFAIAADGLLRVRKTEARRIALVDPDDARVGVDDERAFAEVFEGAEERIHRPAQHVAVGGGNVRPVVIMLSLSPSIVLLSLSHFETSLSH